MLQVILLNFLEMSTVTINTASVQLQCFGLASFTDSTQTLGCPQRSGMFMYIHTVT